MPTSSRTMFAGHPLRSERFEWNCWWNLPTLVTVFVINQDGNEADWNNAVFVFIGNSVEADVDARKFVGNC